jgi:FAD/FMN-containing dehydrogenase
MTPRALDGAGAARLRSQLRGGLVVPGETGYDEARSVFNAMIDRRPAAIARCAGVGDVQACVRFAREHDVLLAVRGGGHNVAGKAVCDDGLVVDLSSLKQVSVDAAARTARAEPGLRLGELDRATQAFGLATPLGIASDTGIAGLTLGGGLGWLNGRLGLSCDNLLAAEVVLADGRCVRASADEDAELLWALQGGGGNFGVVTRFEYRLHELGAVTGGMVLHAAKDAKRVLRFYDEFARGCPDDLSTAAAFLTAPDGSLMLAVAACHSGPPAEGARAVAALRAFGPPAADDIKVMPYVEMQRLLDAAFPPGRFHYWKSGFMRALSDDAIGLMLDAAERKPSPSSLVVLQQMHGAASRVDPVATAFGHRHEQYDLLILASWDKAADSQRNTAWARGLWETLQPHAEDAVYVNDLGEEGEQRVRSAYGPTFPRLAALKRKFDPDNFFRVNQNIRPDV